MAYLNIKLNNNSNSSNNIDISNNISNINIEDIYKQISKGIDLDIFNLNSKEICNSVANLTDTAILVYKIKDLYMSVRDALNKIWEDILDVCNWYERKRIELLQENNNNNNSNNYNEVVKLNSLVSLDKREYITFAKMTLARNDYDSDYISENIDFFYGPGAFENFCKSVFILNMIKED